MFFQLFTGWLSYAKTYINTQMDTQENGQGLVEYALILVMVSVVMVVLLSVMGPAIRNIFANIMFHIGNAANS